MKSQLIPMDKIKITEQYSSTNYEKEAIATLANSIKKCGLLHPITVFKQKSNGYVLLTGGRRFNAYKKLSKEKIPVRVVAEESLDICLAEDLQIKKKNYIQIADSIKVCVESGSSSFKELSKSTGKSIEWIKETLQIATIPKAVQKKLKENKLIPTRAQLLSVVELKKQSDQLKAINGLKLKGIKGNNPQSLGSHSKLNSKYMTVDQFVEAQDMFSTGSLRSHLFNRETNGMVEAGVIEMMGSRILINVRAFWKWVEDRPTEKKAV